MDREAFVLFGLVAAIGLLVAALRSIALRSYRGLLDRGARTEGSAATRGTLGGRRVEIGFTPGDLGARQPTKALVGMECATPVRLEARARSLATWTRTALGIYRETATGIDDLDRRFVFLFLEPDAKKLLTQGSVRGALTTLADRGADHVLLTNGWLTAELPMNFGVPPSSERVRETLAAMTQLSAAAGVGSHQDAVGPAWPAARSTNAGILAPARMAAFFIAMGLAIFIVGPLWNFDGRIPSATKLSLVEARLPALAMVATLGGFLLAFVAPRRPALWALDLSWPLIVHAMIAAVIYALLLVSGIPEIREALGRELEAIPSGTRIAAFAAAIGFGGGLVGALVAGRFDRSSEEP